LPIFLKKASAEFLVLLVLGRKRNIRREKGYFRNIIIEISITWVGWTSGKWAFESKILSYLFGLKAIFALGKGIQALSGL
jgi:hypothetical protein